MQKPQTQGMQHAEGFRSFCSNRCSIHWTSYRGVLLCILEMQMPLQQVLATVLDGLSRGIRDSKAQCGGLMNLQWGTTLVGLEVTESFPISELGLATQGHPVVGCLPVEWHSSDFMRLPDSSSLALFGVVSRT